MEQDPQVEAVLEVEEVWEEDVEWEEWEATDRAPDHPENACVLPAEPAFLTIRVYPVIRLNVQNVAPQCQESR
jgi:hypothetical protein